MPEPRQRPLLGVGLIVLMDAGFAGMGTSVRLLAGVFPVLLMAAWLMHERVSRLRRALVGAAWLHLSARPAVLRLEPAAAD